MTSPGAYQMGGSAPPFDRTAQDTLAAMQQRAQPPPYRRALTEEERAEAEEAARQAEKVCRLCIAIHPLPNTPGCPRLATFKLDGDGLVVEGTFRADTDWQARVVLLEDAHEDGEEAGDDG